MSVSKYFAFVLLLLVGGLALPTARGECPSLFPGDGLYGVGGSPRSVAIADLDGDGDADLAVANHGFGDGGDVSILLNNGDGSFADDVLYDVANSPSFVSIADLDGDGDADVAVASWNDDGDNVSILLNNGDGTFGAAVFYRAGDFPTSVAIADLDGDGDADLAVANQESDNVSILLNNGDGTFADDVLYDVGDAPAYIVSADLDGDGDADLAVATVWDASVSVLLNEGTAPSLRRCAMTWENLPLSWASGTWTATEMPIWPH